MTLTQTDPPLSLKAAIAQAVLQSEQEQARLATEAHTARLADEAEAIQHFQLPFDQETLEALPELNFRFDGNTSDLNAIGYFSYQDLKIEISKVRQLSSECGSWEAMAIRDCMVIAEYQTHVYPNQSWVGYQTPEQLGRDFLVFLHEAADTPTTAPEAVEIPESYERQRLRESLVEAALKGTLIGLTNSGVKEGACLQTALFALETAEQMLLLTDTTPLQRQLLKVLTLEAFTEWLKTHEREAIVGSLDNQDHPLCRYVQQSCGLTLNFCNLALYNESGACVLGNDGNFPLPHELPLDLTGAWLPALLEWKTFDADTDADWPTFAAGEVLQFLESFQR